MVRDFDHIEGKRAAVSALVLTRSLSALREEISRCVVRCANCHRRRTLGALDTYRGRAKVAEPP